MNIAVYCSSSNHIAENYKSTAFEFGKWIATNGNTLVFGGATGGLMSAVSEGAASAKGQIIGVIPQAVIKMNRQSNLCTELICINSMSERKAKMKDIADLFVVFPGSYGTLDEMFDVIASGVVGEHKKPIIIFNENDFYGDLLKMADKMRLEKFIPIENYKPIIVNTLDEIITNIKLVY